MTYIIDAMRNERENQEIRYHVIQDWNSENLESLAKQLGEEDAIEAFLKRWPDADASMANDHIWKIFFYKTIREAHNHRAFFGGEILEINTEAIEIDIDLIEGYEYTSQEISKEFIRRTK